MQDKIRRICKQIDEEMKNIWKQVSRKKYNAR